MIGKYESVSCTEKIRSSSISISVCLGTARTNLPEVCLHPTNRFLAAFQQAIVLSMFFLIAFLVGTSSIAFESTKCNYSSE